MRTRTRTLRGRARLLAPLALLAAATVVGCSADDLVVPNLNNPSAEGLGADALGGLQVAANGLAYQSRSAAAAFVTAVGILGREAYNYTASEPRNTSGYLVGPALLSSGFGGTAAWAARYVNLRNAFNFVEQVNAATALTEAQKQAALGFAKTIEALDLHYLIITRDTIGIPVQILANPDELAPFVTRDSAYAYIVARLDEARRHLQAGGASFGFSTSHLFGGGVSVATPAGFLQFNRALYARLQVYRATLGLAACGAGGATCFRAALDALDGGETFLNANAASAADMARGVAWVYSTTAGDQTNGLNQSASQFLAAHPSWQPDAPRKPDGTPDNRYLAKLRTLATPLSPPPGVPGVTTPLGFAHYPTQDSPLPIIKNEELILLRAEANLGLGNTAAALADLNRVRTVSGGLAPSVLTASSSRAELVAELLLQRRYSLALEGHRWMDVRRYGRLSTLPLDAPSHIVAPVLPVPGPDCLFRGPASVPRGGCVGI
jgi:starch-binding outer membrane protein, SusD/RagB family